MADVYIGRTLVSISSATLKATANSNTVYSLTVLETVGKITNFS